MTNEPEQGGFRDVFLRTIAVLGLIAVLLLGAWGIIQLAVSLPAIFGNIGGSISSIFTNTPKETITVSAPANLSSGQTLMLSWNHSNATNGQYSYTVSYACANGLSVKAPLPTGSYQDVACNTPFNFVNSAAHMTLIPTVIGSASVPLAMTVSATKLSTGAVTTSGSATTNLAPQTAPANATKPAATKPATSSYTSSPSTSYYAAPRQATYYGYADLATHIISATRTSATHTDVRFEIVNIGTNIAVGGWGFNAQLPINGGYTFASQPQRALYPGDKIVYTLGYDNTYQSGYAGGCTYNCGTPYGNYSNPCSVNNGWGYSSNCAGNGYSAPGGYTCNNYGPCNVPGYANNYPNGSNNNHGNSYGYQNGGTVTITVDPYNYLVELTKANNTTTYPVGY